MQSAKEALAIAEGRTKPAAVFVLEKNDLAVNPLDCKKLRVDNAKLHNTR